MYFFTQATPTSSWEIALASERAKVIADRKPELATILDVDNAFGTDLTLDELLAVKYNGPCYFDFDGGGEDLNTVIAQFKTFVNKLKGKSVDLSMVRFYASGGRGFHIEIPLPMLLGKVPPMGVAHLPHIFKEIAYELYVDTLDLRVYSAKKGRMWRCPNFKRGNGKYKVQITADEALAMTPEFYESVCSVPRGTLPVEPPVFNGGLGLLFSVARDKVDAAAKKAKAKKKSAVSLTRFKGDWPKALTTLITTGEGVKDGTGWNRVAMQLSLTGQALGRTEEQVLTDLAPLIETYVGDSERYGSRVRRANHFRDMWRYLEGNITYDFDVAGLGSILDKGFDLAEMECDGYESEEAIEEDEEAEPTEGSEEKPDALPVRLSSKGIWVRGEEGWKRGSYLGMKSPTRLVNEHNKDEGYEVDVFVEGVAKGKQILPMHCFSSKAQFNQFALTWSTSVNISDQQTGFIADLLRRATNKKSAVTYVTHREGIDLIKKPWVVGDGDNDLIPVWVSPNTVITPKGLDFNFRLRSSFAEGGVYRSDLMDAPDVTSKDADLVEALLNLNTPVNVARIFGWFAACFICQHVRHVNNRKFPMLQVYGEAGAGKSHTVSFFNHLHYFKVNPKEQMSAGGTNYPAIAALASSASMPVVFEEMKPGEMSKSRKDFLTSIFRSCYDGHRNERGGLSKTAGPREVVIAENDLLGPLVFVGESLEDQTAIVERCVIVALGKSHRHGRKEHNDLLIARTYEIGKIGKLMAMAAMQTSIDQVRADILRNETMIMDDVDNEDYSRPVKVLAVALTGLDFAQRTIATKFGKKLTNLRSSRCWMSWLNSRATRTRTSNSTRTRTTS